MHFLVNFLKINAHFSENPDREPTIVVDFLSLCNAVTKLYKTENVCGGQPIYTFYHLAEYLENLKKCGCTLVFFADYNIQENKKVEWLRRRNNDFIGFTNLYNWIDEGHTLNDICCKIEDTKALTSTFYGMEQIAKYFSDDFHYTIKHECDVEIVEYAEQNDVLAVISNDTDFLIFNGKYRLWSIQGSTSLMTFQYKENCLVNTCSLSQHQLPLLATLLGNDFTRIYYAQLSDFHWSFGSNSKVKVVSDYVRRNLPNGKVYLSDADIERVTRQICYKQTVCREKIENMQRSIRQSIDSYNTNVPSVADDQNDKVGKQLKKTSMYAYFISGMGAIQGLSLNYYDMRGCTEGANLPMLLTDWIKRRVGVLRKERNDATFKFTLLTKKNIREEYMAHTEEPIYPDCELFS